MMKTVIIDDEGYLTLPESIIEEYGETFRAIEKDGMIELEPIESENDTDN